MKQTNFYHEYCHFCAGEGGLIVDMGGGLNDIITEASFIFRSSLSLEREIFREAAAMGSRADLLGDRVGFSLR